MAAAGAMPSQAVAVDTTNESSSALILYALPLGREGPPARKSLAKPIVAPFASLVLANSSKRLFALCALALSAAVGLLLCCKHSVW